MEDPARTYELTFGERSGYLHALIRSHKMTANAAAEYLRRVAEKCDEQGCQRLLLERDVPMMLRTSDIFQMAEYFARLIRGVRVAIVNPYPDLEDDLLFGVLVSANRGAHFKLFSRVTDGEEWLRT